MTPRPNPADLCSALFLPDILCHVLRFSSLGTHRPAPTRGCGLQSGRIPDEQPETARCDGNGLPSRGDPCPVPPFQTRRNGPVIASHFRDETPHPGEPPKHHPQTLPWRSVPDARQAILQYRTHHLGKQRKTCNYDIADGSYHLPRRKPRLRQKKASMFPVW